MKAIGNYEIGSTYLRSVGIELFQGYYFARPGFECLPTVDFSKI